VIKSIGIKPVTYMEINPNLPKKLTKKLQNKPIFKYRHVNDLSWA